MGFLSCFVSLCFCTAWTQLTRASRKVTRILQDFLDTILHTKIQKKHSSFGILLYLCVAYVRRKYKLLAMQLQCVALYNLKTITKLRCFCFHYKHVYCIYVLCIRTYITLVRDSRNPGKGGKGEYCHLPKMASQAGGGKEMPYCSIVSSPFQKSAHPLPT